MGMRTGTSMDTGMDIGTGMAYAYFGHEEQQLVAVIAI